MNSTETENKRQNTVSQKADLVSFDLSVKSLLSGAVTNYSKNRQLKRKKADSYIREHIVKGKKYYSWARSGEKEIYLGSADEILRKVKGKIGS